jgi:hypothetical protein
MLSPSVAGPAGFDLGLTALTVYLVVIAVAIIADRRGKSAPAPA